jgi:hypothetical protein
VLGDELRVVGALLLERRRQVHDLPGRVHGLDLFLLFLRLARLVLALEIGDDLAGRRLVDHADVDRLLLAAAPGERVLEIRVPGGEEVEPEAHEEQELRVHQDRDTDPKADSTSGCSSSGVARQSHFAPHASISNVAPAAVDFPRICRSVIVPSADYGIVEHDRHRHP